MGLAPAGEYATADLAIGTGVLLVLVAACVLLALAIVARLRASKRVAPVAP